MNTHNVMIDYSPRFLPSGEVVFAPRGYSWWPLAAVLSSFALALACATNRR